MKVLGVPDDEWAATVKKAWVTAECGDIEGARKLYEQADAELSIGHLNADLFVLRHSVGEGSGSVEPIPPTEDVVVSFFLPPAVEETAPLGSMSLPSDSYLSEAIEDFLEGFDPGYHQDNIVEDRPHIQVLSTGRCGTVSLQRLFEGSNLAPYHTYWFMLPITTRWEMMCRFMAGDFTSVEPAKSWLKVRAAEWLGEKPMIGLNHTDTIFAPAFAAIHPKSKFIYLRRDPVGVFSSFFSKGQWRDGDTQLRPLLYDFDPGFVFHRPDVNAIDGIAWHINLTEKFARAFGAVMGDRFIEISADRLFAQDREEIARLLEFVGSDVPPGKAVEHFRTKINEKAHKTQFGAAEMAKAREEFKEKYCQFS